MVYHCNHVGKRLKKKREMPYDHPFQEIIYWYLTRFPYDVRLTVTRRVSHMEQELLTLLADPSSPPVSTGVRVVRYFVLYVMFCRSLFVLFLFTIVFF